MEQVYQVNVIKVDMPFSPIFFFPQRRCSLFLSFFSKMKRSNSLSLSHRGLATFSLYLFFLCFKVVGPT
ncbi:uncharacterized protein DS421_4g131270 [Arachis hypogaea]|nr:uncharacterized protein DS421_4g131270 [Arachis hypogaea]